MDFLTYQKNRYQQQQGQQGSGSPVTSTGQVSPQNASPSPEQQTPGTGGLQPREQPNMGYAPGQGVQGTTSSTGVYTPGQYQQPNWVTYNPQQIQQAQFNPGQQAQYTPGQIAQWQGGPNYQQMQEQQAAMLNQMLQNPGTLNQQVTDQMKGANKDSTLSMQQQMAGKLGSAAAARGMSTTSPYQQAQQSQSMQDAMSNILAANRGIDIQAATQNRMDQLNALNAASGFQNDVLNRAVLGYNTGLAGQQAQEGVNQFGAQFGQQNWRDRAALEQAQAAEDRARFGLNADEGYRGFQSSLGAQDRDMARFYQNEGLQQAGAGSQMQGYQFGQQFPESVRQFNENLKYQREQLERQLAESAAGRGQAQSQWQEQMAMQAAAQEEERQWRMMQAILGGYNPGYGGY